MFRGRPAPCWNCVWATRLSAGWPQAVDSPPRQNVATASVFWSKKSSKRAGRRVSWIQATDTIYSVGMERRPRACLAGSINSRMVSISSSTVSGVNEASPSSGQTHAEILGTRMETPSSSYSKVVGRHSFGLWCSAQIGTDWLLILVVLSFPSPERWALPFLFIWNIGRHKLNVNRIRMFTDYVQIDIHARR